IALKETTSKLQFPQTTTSRQKLPLDYEIKENVIFVGFETGSIEMEVLGYRLDEDGFPLIPDEERTIKCIYWYIAQKVAYPKWAMGKLPDKVFSYVDQQ